MNILDKFKNTSVGSSGRILDYKSIISSSGDFTKVYDADAILLSWSNILTTPVGSMDHDPEFGSHLYLFIYEPADEETQEAIKDDIVKCLSRYDDRAIVNSVTVEFFRNKKGFNVNIIADFKGFMTDMSISFDETKYQNVAS